MAGNKIKELSGKGIIRPLTASETRKGYVFISNDKRLPQTLRSRGLNVIFNGKGIGLKKIDNSGRVYVGRDNLSNLTPRQMAKILLESNDKLVIKTE